MLFRVGVAMLLFSVAVVVAAWVGLSRLDEDSAQQDASLEPLAAGVGEEKDAFDPGGQRLEIDEEHRKKEPRAQPAPAPPPAPPPVPLPLVPQEDWPEPSGEEVAAAANAPRYYPQGATPPSSSP